MSAWPPLAELLPHAGPAILIDEVVENRPDNIIVAATVAADSPWFVPGHGIPVWVGIEMMAQAAAAHGSLEARRKGGGPRRGMLLGTRHYDGRVAWFAEGSRLLIHAEQAFGRLGGGMAACDCRIECAGILLVTATLIIVEETDP